MTARALLAILVFFTVVTLIAVVGSRANPPPDALSIYSAIRPSANMSILSDYACTPDYVPPYVDSSLQSCRIYEGVGYVSVSSRDGLILHVGYFWLGGMTYGDVVRVFGRADGVRETPSGKDLLCWDAGIRAMMPSVNGFRSLRASVEWVTLHRPDAPIVLLINCNRKETS